MDIEARVAKLECLLAAAELQVARQRDILDDCERLLAGPEASRFFGRRSDYKETLDAIRNERQLGADAPPLYLAFISNAPDDFCYGVGLTQAQAVSALSPHLRPADRTCDLAILTPGKSSASFQSDAIDNIPVGQESQPGKGWSS